MKVIKLQNQTGRQMKAFITDCGIVFLPAALFGNEDSILLCCGYDGAEVVQHDGHIYAAAEWLATEFPEHKEQIKTLIQQIRMGGRP